MDTLSPTERSRIMALVRQKNTRPEMIVRRLVHSLGYRYRLHVRTLSGVPDMVFPARRAVILIHGCFWHRHSCFNGKRMPKSRVAFWRKKLGGNKIRDVRQQQQLRWLGWRVLVVWECQIRKTETLMGRLVAFLGK